MLILGLDKWLAAWAVHSDRLGFKSLLLLINWVNHLISLSKKKKYNHEYLYHFAGGGCNADLLGLGSLVELVSCLTGNFFLSRK